MIPDAQTLRPSKLIIALEHSVYDTIEFATRTLHVLGAAAESAVPPAPAKLAHSETGPYRLMSCFDTWNGYKLRPGRHGSPEKFTMR